MKVSVLVTSFLRGHLFKETIKSILPQLNEEDEIVVVDDGLLDGIRNVLVSSGVLYQYVRTKNSEYRNGAIAKNIGLRLARNELIIINDPEVYQKSRCIDQLREHFKNRQRIFVNAATMYFCQNPLNPFTPTTKMENSMAPFIAGVLKKELMAINGWNERFKFWGNEDNDLMGRLQMNGVEHIPDRKMIGVHFWHHRPPQNVIGDANESLLYEKNKSIKANKGKKWGILK